MKALTNIINKNTMLLLGLMVVLGGCGGGASTERSETGDEGNVNQGQAGLPAYTGPDPQTEEQRLFKIYFYDVYRATDSCGACHTNSGNGTGAFADSDNLISAYNVAVNYINRANPSSSEFVTKVATGHGGCNGLEALCTADMTRAINGWLGNIGSETTEIQLTAPNDHDITVTKQLPVTGSSDYSSVVTAFSNTVYPELIAYSCDGCHNSDAATPQQPYFASSDLNEAYDAARSKIDIEDGVQDRALADALSRFVVRLRSEAHNCGGDCTTNATDMLAAIKAFEDLVPAPNAIPDNWVTSKALILERDGILASGGGRIDTGSIAKWDFSEGSGTIAGDSSDVQPRMNLNLVGNVAWVGGNGIQILEGGKAQATTASSKKLADNIKLTGAYSIEAWVAPANVTQEGPARIISYSSGTEERNFTLGQTLYNYDFLHRSTTTTENGEAALSTADDDERLQATLQHVVITFDPTNGRQIYVNGNHTGDDDPVSGGALTGWDDGFVFILGNEASNNRQWEGIIRFVAIYDRPLTQEEIDTNFEAGVGEKYYLLFNVTEQVDIDDGYNSYIVFETSIFDSYSYLFNQPFLYRIGGPDAEESQASYTNIPVEGMRIGVNGKEPGVGQAYSKLDTALDSSLYGDTGQILSPIGTIIASENGSNSDEFFLTFEQIGAFSDVRVEATVSPVLPTASDQEPDIGLRNFAEISASMSVITGVPVTNANVAATFNTVKQQLPTSSAVETFVSAQQMAVAQMAIEYCSELVDNTGLRNGFFPGFVSNFDLGVSTAFDTSTERDGVIDPIFDNVVGANMGSQPDEAAMKAELDDLIQILAARHSGDPASQTQNIVKATCAAALGSAAILVQ